MNGSLYGKSVKFVGVPSSPGGSQDLEINNVPDSQQPHDKAIGIFNVNLVTNILES